MTHHYDSSLCGGLLPCRVAAVPYFCLLFVTGHHDRAIYDIVWSNQSGMIATAAGDNTIKIFKEEPGGSPDAPSFSVLASIPDAHMEDVNTIAWSPTEAVLASGSDDGVLKLWQIAE